MNNHSRKVLIVSFYYPPFGGGGVQRTAKFAKYLPRFGYAPIVVAASPELLGDTSDSELAGEVKQAPRYDMELSPSDRRLQRFGRRSVGRLLNIQKTFWLSAAARACRAAIREHRPDLIMASVSPFPAAGLAARLSARYGIPWVLDMRDPWALDPVNFYQTELHYLLDRRAMRNACRRANAVIMNTPHSLEAMRRCMRFVSPEKYHCITNGWDANDFVRLDAPPAPPDSSRPMTVVHTGAFHTQHASEAAASKGFSLRKALKYSLGDPDMLARTPYYLFRAFSDLVRSGGMARESIRFVLAGRLTEADRDLARHFGIADRVDMLGYVTHRQSVDLLRSADVLFLPLHLPQGGRDPLIVPGKAYEYLAARKPILALVPPGDARTLVETAGLGFACDPTDVPAISARLIELSRQHRGGGIRVEPKVDFINQYERSYLTERLARVFDSALVEAGRGTGDGKE
jgi:glycosyltransferase involved in cell wall biosynthesis